MLAAAWPLRRRPSPALADEVDLAAVFDAANSTRADLRASTLPPGWERDAARRMAAAVDDGAAGFLVLELDPVGTAPGVPPVGVRLATLADFTATAPQG